MVLNFACRLCTNRVGQIKLIQGVERTVIHAFLQKCTSRVYSPQQSVITHTEVNMS
jgi:hypothetical protein